MNQVDATNWVAIGPHVARFEAPDLILTRAVGTLSGPEAMQTWKLAEEWAKDVPDLYWITDIAQFEHYSGAALQAARTQGVNVMQKLRCLVCVGGNYRQRTALSVVIKAGELLRLVLNVPEIAFVDSEEDARVFVDKLRQRRTGVD